MALRKTVEVVAKLAERGVIQRYAIAGAVAALNYIQPTLTEDLDILVSAAHFAIRPSGLILLTPIEQALADMVHRAHRPGGHDRRLASSIPAGGVGARRRSFGQRNRS